jgi:hypothetical protein
MRDRHYRGSEISRTQSPTGFRPQLFAITAIAVQIASRVCRVV